MGRLQNLWCNAYKNKEILFMKPALFFSGSFYLRETGEIRDVYKIFLLVECPFHIVNIFLLLICPNFIFSSKTLVNLNLKVSFL